MNKAQFSLWVSLTSPRKGSKFNLHHQRKTSTVFKMTELTPKSILRAWLWLVYKIAEDNYRATFYRVHSNLKELSYLIW